MVTGHNARPHVCVQFGTGLYMLLSPLFPVELFTISAQYSKKQKNKQKKEQMAQLDQTNIFTTKGKLIFGREKEVALSPVTVQLQQSG